MLKRHVVLSGLAIGALVLAPGCVTKKLFRKNVEQTDTRVAGVENAVEENERRIADLDRETDSRIAAIDQRAEKAVEIGSSALNLAEQATERADAAARGRLLWTVTLSDDRVRFSFDEANLSDAAQQDLDGLAAQLKGLGKAVYLEIEGHTDNIGSESYNRDLGQQRAMAVLRYLNQSGGIPLHAMSAISYGSSRPVADNGSRDGRSQNRRVVVRVLE